MEGVIYVYKLNGEVKYVGQTVNLNQRKSSHASNAFNEKAIEYNYPISRAIRKHGREAFDIEIIDRGANKEELDKKEIYWIEYYNTYKSHLGYNQTPGGEDNSYQFQHSEEIVDRVIELLQERRPYEEIARETGVSFSHISGINTGAKRRRPGITYPINKMTKGRITTDEQVVEAIKMLQTTQLTLEKIGELVGLSGATVRGINAGRYSYLPQEYNYPIRRLRNVSREEAEDIARMIEETDLTFVEIAKKFRRTSAIVSNINKGQHRYSPKREYPIRK